MYSASYEQRNVDVIIVGAGISGLTAAFYIFQREPTLSIVVLEANDRIGGRIESEPVQIGSRTVNLDMGGQFFLKSQTPLIKLLECLDLKYVEKQPSQGDVLGVFQNGVLTSATKPPCFGSLADNIELIKFFGHLEALSENVVFNNAFTMIDSDELDKISMEKYINENLHSETNRSYVKAILTIIYGVQPSRISVLCYIAFCNSTDGIKNQIFISSKHSVKCWIDGGAGMICEKIMDVIGGENIIIREQVVEIVREDKWVTIITAGVHYKCQYAIVAVPPRQVLEISFSPSLSHSRIIFLSSMSRGVAIKFVATYQRPFWESKNLSGDIIFCREKSPVLVCFDMSTSDLSALCGYVNPNFSTDQRRSFKSEVLAELSRYMGEDILSPLTYVEKHWSDESYPCSCPFSTPALNSLRSFQEFKSPTGRLFWAGSETSYYWNGHIAGAVQAGYMASIELLYDLRPQSLTVKDIAALKPKRTVHKKYRDSVSYKWLNWKFIVPVGLGAVVVFVYVRKRLK